MDRLSASSSLKMVPCNPVYMKYAAPEQVWVYGTVAMTATPGWGSKELNPGPCQYVNNKIQLAE